MKNFYLGLHFLIVSICFSQAGAPASPYYSGFNWTLTGTSLKTALANKLTTKHTHFLVYTPEVWEASKVTDLDPNNSNNVMLIYGWENGTDADVTNDLYRDKNSNGGNTGDWNREHVYAKSLGTPQLDDSGVSDAGEDAHHLRSSDVTRNNSRGNLFFAAGTGNSHGVTGGWYPGDQWKGDVARIVMYMYLRYGSQCLPKNVTTGTAVTTDTNMVALLLQWNSEDPVSQYEDNRNTYHGNTSNAYAQGNRNPFIDNPYLATLIWGGPVAQNRWPSTIMSTDVFDYVSVDIYPNPTNNQKVNINSTIDINSIQLINVNGQLIMEIKNSDTNIKNFTIDNLEKGFYFIKLNNDQKSITRKIIVN
jgi:endonuclease I